MAQESIYLEPSVISYYAARPSQNLIVAAHQQITWEWWDRSIDRYAAFISLLSLEEISRGDPEAAARRLELVKTFELLDITPRIEELAAIYLKTFDIPGRWEADAIHVATASVHEIDYLVTWNCTHIANARIIRELPKINESMRASTPTICTPEELQEE